MNFVKLYIKIKYLQKNAKYYQFNLVLDPKLVIYFNFNLCFNQIIYDYLDQLTLDQILLSTKLNLILNFNHFLFEELKALSFNL